jgi:TonB family protein
LTFHSGKGGPAPNRSYTLLLEGGHPPSRNLGERPVARSFDPKPEAYMFARQTYVGIFLVATATLVSSQSNQAQAPDFRAGSASKALSSAMAASASERERSMPGEAEILTDTRGVNFSAYVATARRIVRSHWTLMIPSQAYPPLVKQGEVSVDFYVMKDGKVKGVKIHKSSGDEALDHAAWASITASNQFPPLPSDFTGERMGMRFHYFYNLHGQISLRVIPSLDVRIPVGSALQFSVSGEEAGTGLVRWSVSGPGCSKSTCGKISETGFYTAPSQIPDPPTVIVQAVSRGDTDTSEVTVVQATSSH